MHIWTEFLILHYEYKHFHIACFEPKWTSHTAPQKSKYWRAPNAIETNEMSRIHPNPGAHLNGILHATAGIWAFSRRVFWTQMDVANYTTEPKILTCTKCNGNQWNVKNSPKSRCTFEWNSSHCSGNISIFTSRVLSPDWPPAPHVRFFKFWVGKTL